MADERMLYLNIYVEMVDVFWFQRGIGARSWRRKLVLGPREIEI
jgi:hypothetical protein